MLVTDKNLQVCISKIKEAKYCSLDTESTGLDVHGVDSLFAISICTDSHEVFYFDFRNYTPRSALKELTIALKPPKLIFLANAKFDMHLLCKEGVEIDADICDILILDKLIYNCHMEYSLKAVAARFGESKSDEVDKYIKEHSLYEERNGSKSPRFDLVPRDILQEYAERDAYITLKVAEKQLKKVAEMDNEFQDSKLSPVVAFEGLVTKACFKIEQTGMKVDRDYINRAIEFEESRSYNLKNRWKELTGYDFVDSNKNLSFIFSQFGFSGGVTEKGNPSYTESNLLKIDHELARIIESYRDSVKRVSTYYKAFLNSTCSDERVRPNIRQAGADTFRFSVTSPALQTLNKSDDSPFKVRNCFVASEGYKLVAVDYKAQEYRLSADYAGEKELIAAIKSGTDVHTATAHMIGTDRTTAKCIAEDSLVLTNKGLIKIQDITLGMKVWDGVEWVSHSGVIYQGEKEVIEYEGLIATEDHQVYTKQEGSMAFGDYASQQKTRQLLYTAVGKFPLRYSEVRFIGDFERKIYLCLWGLQCLWEKVQARVQQYYNKEDYELQMPKEYEVSSDNRCKEIGRKISGRKTEVHQLWKSKLGGLRRSWSSNEDIFQRFFEFLFEKLYGRSNIKLAIGPYQQQWALRNWEYTPCPSERKSTKQTLKPFLYLQKEAYKLRRSVGEFKKRLSRLQSFKMANIKTSKGWGSSGEHIIKKTTRKVYDIQNAGPRYRFTVNNICVKNCVNFMLLYGGGTQKLADSLKLSYDEADKLKKTYFRNLPNISRLIKKATSTAKTRGWIFNTGGYRLQFPDPKFAYKATNYLIQSSGAYIMRQALVHLQEYLEPFKSRIVMTIHDEILFEVHEDELDIIPHLRAIMKESYQPRNGLGMDTSLAIGDRWGELHEQET